MLIKDLFDAITIGNKANEKLQLAARLLDCKDNPDICKDGLKILDSIGVGSNPGFGKEIIGASVYYMKALFYQALSDDTMAKYCLNVVEEIPQWYVIYGRDTLLDIKEEARKLRRQID